MKGSSGNDVIYGGGGNDVIAAGAGNDIVFGGSGDDTIDGGDGNDVIDGGAGNNTLSGGAGNDILYGGTGDSVIDGGAGNDILFGGAGNDLIDGGSGNDIIFGGTGNDTISGGAGNEIIAGGAGADILSGGAGTDTADYSTSSAAVRIDLATGRASGGDAQGDELSGFENLTGSAFADSLTGDQGNNVLEGRAGADSLDGGAGIDTASYVRSGAGVSVSLATGRGTGGDAQGDTLRGIENLTGSAFADSLTGDAGANLLDGGAGADRLDGGAGTDTASYARSASAVSVDLAAGTGSGGDAEGDTLRAIENLAGSSFADTLSGDAGANLLDGGAGDDLLSGQGGNDRIDGGAGVDTAIFSGSLRDYTLSRTASGWTVSDRVAGRDGTDTLTAVERLQFADHSVAIDGGNNAPLLDGPLSVSTDEDRPALTVNLLTGATDLEGSALSVGTLTQSGGRPVSYRLDGAVLTLDPAQFGDLRAGETAILTFNYQVSDGQASTGQTLTVAIEGRNDAPVVASALSAAVSDADGALSVNLLAGASDIDGGSVLSAVDVAQTGGRTAAFSVVDGALVLDPAQFRDLAAGETVTLSFAYGVSDGTATVPQTLTVTVTGTNDLPVVASALSAAAVWRQIPRWPWICWPGPRTSMPARCCRRPD